MEFLPGKAFPESYKPPSKKGTLLSCQEFSIAFSELKYRISTFDVFGAPLTEWKCSYSEEKVIIHGKVLLGV